MSREQHTITCEEIKTPDGRMWNCKVTGEIESWRESEAWGDTYASYPCSDIVGDLEITDIELYDDAKEEFLPYTGDVPDALEAEAFNQFEKRAG